MTFNVIYEDDTDGGADDGNDVGDGGAACGCGVNDGSHIWRRTVSELLP